MDLDELSSVAGIIFVLLVLLLFCNCCRRRDFGQPVDDNQQQQQPRQGRRQKNARRKWRRRRENPDRVIIVEHEAPCPESAVGSTHSPAPNPQYIINLNPPSQMPFQAQQQRPWQSQQVVQNVQFPPPPHVSGVFPHNAPIPYVQQPQQQAGGFAQLYAQAQPDMNVFPQPPPPYETQPFFPLPKQK